ncbi:hypothetical protein RI367_005784 [Sorochytrium milnesiophthora]
MADTGRQDLQKERSNAAFDVQKMHVWVVEGEERARKKKICYDIIERDPALSFAKGHPFDLSTAELREKSDVVISKLWQTMAQIRRFVEVSKSFKDPDMKEVLLYCMCELSESFSMRTFVAESLFSRSFRLFGTKEQYDAWIDDIMSWRAIGCFGMTELGHSSSLRGIETTATYDPEHEEFIIHSPSITATKWYAALCQLIVNGTEHGLHWFVVQLRDQKTGRFMPGVACGDIGHKAGRNGLDNGWILFSHARIPRENMLMRWAAVDRSGKFTAKTTNAAISYAGLIAERLEITKGIPSSVGQALTIATRYTCMRRQGQNNEQIMDYTTVSSRLVPAIATIYAVLAVDRMVWKHWFALEDAAVDDVATFTARLPDMHAISSGIKATVTWFGTEVLESCRRVMGGHAYSSYNAIPSLIGDFGVMTTGGGDNFVLAQQTTRYLLSCLRRAVQKKETFAADSSVAYLNRLREPIMQTTKNTFFASNSKAGDDVQQLYDTFIWLCLHKLQSLDAKLAQSLASNTPSHAWNQHLPDLVTMGTLHTHAYIMRAYVDLVLADPQSPLHATHALLCRLYISHQIQRHVVDYIKLCPGYFGPAQLEALDAYVAHATAEARTQALALVDAWGFPDFVLKAPLGRYAGDGYTAYVNMVRNVPTTTFGNPAPYWDREVRPLTSPKL